MNNSTVNIKPIQLEKQYAIDALKDADFGESWFVTANRALALQAATQQPTSQQCEYVEIALAEQQEHEYITADEARALGVGNAEYQYSKNNAHWSNWIACFGVYEESDDSWKVRYRAIKQAQPETIIKHFGTIHEENGKLMFTDFSVDGCGATDDSQTATAKAVIKRIEASLKQSQPEPTLYEQAQMLINRDVLLEPIDPHADNFAEESHPAYRAMYAKQVAEGTTGFYLWEFMTTTNLGVWQQKTTGDEPHWTATTQYRCKDISCYVSKDGEPAIRMLRTEAQELQRQTKDTHEWFDPSKFSPWYDDILCFDANGTYAPKALKQVSWSDMPVGVMTNKGELRFVNPVNNMACCEKGEKSLNNWVIVEQLTLAPASEQPWMYWGGGECPVPEGCMFEVVIRDSKVLNGEYVASWSWEHEKHSADIIAYRITGIAEGYKMEGSV